MGSKTIEARYLTALFAFAREVSKYDEAAKLAASSAREMFPNNLEKSYARTDRLLTPTIKKLDKHLTYLISLRNGGTEAIKARARFRIKSDAHKRRREYDVEWLDSNLSGDSIYSGASFTNPRKGHKNIIRTDDDININVPSYEAREEMHRAVIRHFKKDFATFNEHLDLAIQAFFQIQFIDKNARPRPFFDKDTLKDAKSELGKAMSAFARLTADYPGVFTPQQDAKAQMLSDVICASEKTTSTNHQR